MRTNASFNSHWGLRSRWPPHTRNQEREREKKRGYLIIDVYQMRICSGFFSIFHVFILKKNGRHASVNDLILFFYFSSDKFHQFLAFEKADDFSMAVSILTLEPSR